MITAARLGGFFGAHAIWCVSRPRAELLVPMLAYQGPTGRHMERYPGDLTQRIAAARERMIANPMDADDAVLVYDGRITLGATKLDAILVEHRAFFSPSSEMVLALPYTPATDGGSFRVHRPKLVVWTRCEDFERRSVLEAFFEGIESHAKAAAIWAESLDESMVRCACSAASRGPVPGRS